MSSSGATPIKSFLKHHYRHFNAAVVIDAAEAYTQHLADGGKMLVTLAGAMSTAELGLSLAEMIRQKKSTASAAPARISKRTYTISSRTITTSACRTIVISPPPGSGASRAITSIASPIPASPKKKPCAASSAS